MSIYAFGCFCILYLFASRHIILQQLSWCSSCGGLKKKKESQDLFHTRPSYFLVLIIQCPTLLTGLMGYCNGEESWHRGRKGPKSGYTSCHVFGRVMSCLKKRIVYNLAAVLTLKPYLTLADNDNQWGNCWLHVPNHSKQYISEMQQLLDLKKWNPRLFWSAS